MTYSATVTRTGRLPRWSVELNEVRGTQPLDPFFVHRPIHVWGSRETAERKAARILARWNQPAKTAESFEVYA